jgi:hypothetical protein
VRTRHGRSLGELDDDELALDQPTVPELFGPHADGATGPDAVRLLVIVFTHVVTVRIHPAASRLAGFAIA